MSSQLSSRPTLTAQLALAVTAAAAALLWLTLGPNAGAQVDAPEPPYDPLTTRPSDEGTLGEVTYERYCAGCHGTSGDGQGLAAPFLNPKPRDFTKGRYKFTSTPAGSLPLDRDLLRTITYGLRGTSMPGWRLLPLHEREALVQHLKSFYADWDEEFPEPEIPFYQNPYDVTDEDTVAEAVERGKVVYHKTATCWQCHPSYLPREELETLIGGPARPDLNQALAKPDMWGQVIPPPDFPRVPLKSVRTLKDLYRVITAGVGGTAMPSWAHALSAEDLWALTLYVDSIRLNPSLQNKTGGERD